MTAAVRCCVVVCAIALAVGTLPVLASQGVPAAQGDPKVTQMKGELLRVDSKAKTLTIKDGGSNVDFRYTDKTEVTGADKDVAGLATMNGAQVTVHYKLDQPGAPARESQPVRIATKIEVHPRS